VGRGDARPVHSTAQNPFQGAMVQRELCSQGGATHAVVNVRLAKGFCAAALHDRGIERQHGQAEAVIEASLDFSSCEIMDLREQESDQPGQSRTAGAAKKRSRVCLFSLSRSSRRLSERWHGSRRSAGILYSLWWR
jgi:hypothetical protein